MRFDEAFDKVVGIEGRYSNNPNDSGGETMYGITIAVAHANGYTGEMRDMPLSVARAIYKSMYWDLLHLDDICLISGPVADELFDTAVNCGVGNAAKFFQRSLSSLNRQGKDYPDVKIDGAVGPMSVQAFSSFMKIRETQGGERVILRCLNALQGAYYIELTERRPKDEDFLFGWIKNRIVI